MDTGFQIAEIELKYKTKVKPSQRLKLNSSSEVYELLLHIFDMDTIEYKEYFKIILLNKANKVLGIHNLSIGGIDGTYADIRQILQIALLANACGLIISHNHPSGELIPSIQDSKLTQAIKKACDFMNIKLLDHLIVSMESYYSFADEGLI